MRVIRFRHRSVRPDSELASISPTGMDFEKRKITFPPGFIDEIVIKGGNEYVKASDLVTIVNAFIAKMEELRVEMAQIKLHLASQTDENIEEKDAQQSKVLR